MNGDPPDRLAPVVRAWRTALGYSVIECTQLARNGIERATWSKVENGKSPTYAEGTYAAIDRVFGWEIGTAAAVHAGTQPAPDLPVPERNDVTMRLARLERRLEMLEARQDADLDRVERWLRQRPEDL